MRSPHGHGPLSGTLLAVAVAVMLTLGAPGPAWTQAAAAQVPPISTEQPAAPAPRPSAVPNQTAAPAKPSGPEVWEKEIARFEAADRDRAEKTTDVLFVGSSSIRLWKTSEAFPDLRLLNRGFGGSQLSDVRHFFDRIVLPSRPRMIVLYGGDNDLAKGRTVDAIVADYRAIAARVRQTLPETRIVWISVKPSPKRWELREQQQQVNRLVADEIRKSGRDVNFDSWPMLLSPAGEPDPDCFIKDRLHLSEVGYARWNAALRPLLTPAPPPTTPGTP